MKAIYNPHQILKLPHKLDNLRIGRRSIPGGTYAVVKNAGDLYRPILPDPRQRLWRAKEAVIIIQCLEWLKVERWLDPIAYVIMPDHIHIIFKLGDVTTLSGVMSTFGKYTARQINRLHGCRGSFWQHYYYDRRVRSEQELRNQVEYVRNNPVKKGFVKRFADWPYGWCRDV